MTREQGMSKWIFALVLAAWVSAATGRAASEEEAVPVQPMRPISLEYWEDFLGKQGGRVVVVDLWASWCISCIERFPGMVEMSEHFTSRGVRFVTLNLDDPQDVGGIQWANEFLARMGGEFAHFHLDESLTRSFEALDLKSLPVVLIFDGQGEERYRLTNDNPNSQFTEADIERAIKGLLDGSAAVVAGPVVSE
jgi:thiol-disulfide isomerase/thioredoxin